MIEINLLPEEMRRKESTKIAMPEIPIRKTLFVFFAVFIALQLLLTATAFYFKIRGGFVAGETAELREATREITAQKAETAKVETRLREIDSLTKRNFYWASLLDALANSMTKGVWLRGLSVIEDAPVRKSESSAKSKKKENAPARESGKKKDAKKDSKKKESPEEKKAAKEKKKKEEDKRKKSEKSEEPEKVRALKLEGSAVGQGQETAYIGKFLKELEGNAFFGGIFSGIELSNINQRKVKDFDVYDFTLICRFKKEKI